MNVVVGEGLRDGDVSSETASDVCISFFFTLLLLFMVLTSDEKSWPWLTHSLTHC